MPRGMRREDRRVVALLAFFHGAVHANVLAIPVFLLAWRTEFQADDVTLGLLASIAYGGYGIGSVPFGFLADRRSPGRLLVLCGLGTAASLGGIALSPSIPALAVGLGTLGFFSGIYHPTGLSVISRTVAQQGRGMGWHGMGGSLGIASGPAAVGAVLAFGGSWRLAAAALILPSLIATALLLAGLLPPTGAEPSGATRGSLRRLFTIPYVRILLVYMFAGFAYQGGLTFLPRFVGAAAFAVALGLGAIGQILSGTLADRTHPDRILFGLSLVAAGILLALALLPTSGAFTVAALAFGFVLFSLEPLQNTLVAGEAPRSLRGLAFGFSFLSVFGVGSIGALLAGWMLAQNAAKGLFAVLGACLAVSGGLAFGVRGARPS
ncbi:MAG: MFS transporter [Methanobacteriota archaeon]|nr:MAG: MFS transporter [Euryarchaeota archaeon]